jgi:hypothetical protein
MKDRSPEQKLIDIMFEIAQVSAIHMHGKPREEICAWVADQLRKIGFPTTPCGISWGVLEVNDLERNWKSWIRQGMEEAGWEADYRRARA